MNKQKFFMKSNTKHKVITEEEKQKPNQDDIEITNRIISACKFMRIKVLDHVIIEDNTYFSFFNEVFIREE